MVPRQVLDWLAQAFPKPEVDNVRDGYRNLYKTDTEQEWIQACYDWVMSQGNPVLPEIEAQLLQSDLRDSMRPNTGLPRSIFGQPSVTLSGPPILVEIVDIMEIAHSATALGKVRDARTEAMRTGGGVVGLDDDGDVEEAEAGEAEEETKVSKYPRGMLKFLISDGSLTIPAIEYRRIPEFELGVTALGYKLQLKHTVIRRGIAFLEPATVVLHGYCTTERDASREEQFARGLRARLGQPDPEPEPAQDEPGPTVVPTPSSQTLYESQPAPRMQTQPHTQDQSQTQVPTQSSRTMINSPYFTPSSNPNTSTSTNIADIQAAFTLTPSRSSTFPLKPDGNNDDDDFHDLAVEPGRLHNNTMDEDESAWMEYHASKHVNNIQSSSSSRDFPGKENFYPGSAFGPNTTQIPGPSHVHKNHNAGPQTSSMSNLERDWGSDGREEFEFTRMDVEVSLVDTGKIGGQPGDRRGRGSKHTSMGQGSKDKGKGKAAETEGDPNVDTDIEDGNGPGSDYDSFGATMLIDDTVLAALDRVEMEVSAGASSGGDVSLGSNTGEDSGGGSGATTFVTGEGVTTNISTEGKAKAKDGGRAAIGDRLGNILDLTQSFTVPHSPTSTSTPTPAAKTTFPMTQPQSQTRPWIQPQSQTQTHSHIQSTSPSSSQTSTGSRFASVLKVVPSVQLLEIIQIDDDDQNGRPGGGGSGQCCQTDRSSILRGSSAGAGSVPGSQRTNPKSGRPVILSQEVIDISDE